MKERDELTQAIANVLDILAKIITHYSEEVVNKRLVSDNPSPNEKEVSEPTSPPSHSFSICQETPSF